MSEVEVALTSGVALGGYGRSASFSDGNQPVLILRCLREGGNGSGTVGNQPACHLWNT